MISGGVVISAWCYTKIRELGLFCFSVGVESETSQVIFTTRRACCYTKISKLGLFRFSVGVGVERETSQVSAEAKIAAGPRRVDGQAQARVEAESGSEPGSGFESEAGSGRSTSGPGGPGCRPRGKGGAATRDFYFMGPRLMSSHNGRQRTPWDPALDGFDG